MPKRILIVDDSKLIHSMYEQLLTAKYSCEIFHAMDGVEALFKLSKGGGVDLILLDIDMPVMNGIQFLTRRAEEKNYSHVPVIVVSTRSAEEDIKTCLRLGATAYILKPFAQDQFYNLIDKVFADKDLHGG